MGIFTYTIHTAQYIYTSGCLRDGLLCIFLKIRTYVRRESEAGRWCVVPAACRPALKHRPTLPSLHRIKPQPGPQGPGGWEYRIGRMLKSVHIFHLDKLFLTSRSMFHFSNSLRGTLPCLFKAPSLQICMHSSLLLLIISSLAGNILCYKS